MAIDADRAPTTAGARRGGARIVAPAAGSPAVIPALAGTTSVPLMPDVDRVAAERRLALLGMAVILVVGAAIRLVNINAIGLNSDEAVYSGQAAALAGDVGFQQFFAIFRAHPLLVQFLLAVLYQFGVNDVAGRLLSVAFGVTAIAVTYMLGSVLFSRRAGVLAAAIIAFVPYHVMVSRQMLLDGPEMTLWLIATYCMAKYVVTDAARWFYAMAFTAGLTVLAKETAVLLVVVMAAFVLMTPVVRLGLRRIVVAFGCFLLAVSPYPAAILLSGASDTARQFLLWQVLRQPNHTATFYVEVLWTAVGPFILLVAILGVIASVRIGHWQDRLLVAWLFVPIAFFEIWPVKGFQYLLPIAPAIAIAAARAFEAPWTDWLADQARRFGIAGRLAGARAFAGLVIPVLLLLTLAPPTTAAVLNTSAQGSLAGTGGLPGGREAGKWISENVPAGARFMTIGPTMSNIIQFYGHRHSLALSVSPNPQRRNPAYDPILNPDRSIQTLEIHYAAFDVWSAARSPFFATTLRRYLTKYNGRLVYEQHATVRNTDGSSADEVVIQIYELTP
jgi:4-amino-4-deoxy-L-arabinose transferase-like glycosyltransferase